MAGLVKTTTANSDLLSPEHAEMLQAKVEEAGLFAQPSELGAPAKGADRFSYKLIIEDQGRTHSVLLNEDDMPQELRALIDWVSSVPGHQDRLGSPGKERQL